MPRKRALALFTSIPLDPSSPDPLYRQLYDRVRSAILRGSLSAGTRLPSSRALADGLSISRNTVLIAYGQLLAEGYVQGEAGSGTYVSRVLPEQFCEPAAAAGLAHRPTAKSSPTLSQRGQILAADPVRPSRDEGPARAFAPAVPALDAFPFEVWTRLLARRWRARPSGLLGYGNPAGYRPLREAIAAYLGTARAVTCDVEQVIVVSGSQRALDLTARLLLDPGDAAWVEDPGYPRARGVLQGAGARVVGVPVDGEGLDVAAGVARCPGARLACVTPSRQYPLGMTMSLPRRLRLLEWASRAGAWVVEDDYDSEYRYAGRPLASLQGLDREGRVIYLGSFSKVLFPALRLGYLVVPPALVDAFTAAHALVEGQPRLFEQAVLADFMTQGHFVRHIRRMRMLYAERQAVLVKAARRELDGLLEVPAAESGMHLIGWLPEGVSDQAASRQAAQEGVVAQPLSPYGLTPQLRGGLLLGYAALAPRQIREGVRLLATALRLVASKSTPSGSRKH
jgi:GntR family transcriptional regulator/MocR family aminotransferase